MILTTQRNDEPLGPVVEISLKNDGFDEVNVYANGVLIGYFSVEGNKLLYNKLKVAQKTELFHLDYAGYVTIR